MTDIDSMQMLTLKQAARLLGISRNKVYRMAFDGTLVGAVRLETTWRVRPSEFYQHYGLTPTEEPTTTT